MNRGLGILGLIGAITAVLLIIAFAQTGWGVPGTPTYQSYESLNRLMAFSLLLMAAGWLGMVLLYVHENGRWGAILAFVGSLIMVVGTAAEFWLFSDLAYSQGSNLRNAAWSTFGLGSLLLDVGAMILGVAIWRSRSGSRWRAVVLLLALPMDFTAFFLIGSPFLGAAILAFVVGSLLLSVDKFPTEIKTTAS